MPKNWKVAIKTCLPKNTKEGGAEMKIYNMVKHSLFYHIIIPNFRGIYALPSNGYFSSHWYNRWLSRELRFNRGSNSLPRNKNKRDTVIPKDTFVYFRTDLSGLV
jgi:hypothetical protein